jgi:hypothetical protein
MFRILWSIFREYIMYLIEITPCTSAQHNTADTGTTGPQYATKHRPRTPTIDEPHGVISIKYRIYSLKMDHRIRNM